MSRNTLIVPLILSLLLIAGSWSSAQGDIISISPPGSFLGSPRIIAMGGTYVAVADDANTVFLNPAGLGDLTNNDISASCGSILGDVSQKSIVGRVGLGEYGRLGYGYNVIGTHNTSLYDSSNNLLGTEDYSSSDLALSYGYPVYDWLFLGATAHRLSSGFSGYFTDKGEGYGLSLGLLLKTSRHINVGLVLEDVYATDFVWDNGSHERVVRRDILGLSFQPIQNKILLAMDLSGNTTGTINDISVGCEFAIVEWLKFRMGGLFSKDSSAKYIGTGSAGLGIKLFSKLNLDYAIQRPSDLRADSQYFSMGYKF